MNEIVWRMKPKFETDSSIYSILNYRTNEEEVFYHIKEHEINTFLNQLTDKRKMLNIHNDIRNALKQSPRKYVIKFNDNAINKVVFLPNHVLIIFDEIELKYIDKYIYMLYSTFISQIYYKRAVNIKIVVISTKGVD